MDTWGSVEPLLLDDEIVGLWVDRDDEDDRLVGTMVRLAVSCLR